jgi:beta-mannosidase
MRLINYQALFLSFTLMMYVGAACHKAVAGDWISLSGSDWRVHDDPQSQGVAEGYYNADLTGSGWLPAQVPGNIQADVETAHLVGPLWYGAINTNVYEIARKDWWYRKDFAVPTSYQGRRITLDFDGVDEHCKVWLNGTLIGENGGMFRRFWFDVTGMVLPGQINHLAVQINKIPGALEPILIDTDGPNSGAGTPYSFLDGINQTSDILKDLKTPGVWSYDWSANVWTLGIWKDVRLEATGPVRIEWTRVETTLDNDYTQAVVPPSPESAGMVTVSQGSNTFSRATVHATLEVNSFTNGTVRASFRVRGVNTDVSVSNGVNTDVSVSINASLTNGLNLIKASLVLDQPALWWPSGQGGQPLYTLDAQLQPTNGGPVIDKSCTRFGVRELRWLHIDSTPNDLYIRSNYYTLAEYNASDYQLLVNGRVVRGLGTAITLPYILPGHGSAHELQLLQFAKNAGMNLVRLNGGGGGPLFDESWYDLADELGIMIAYEYPAGNCILESDPVFLTNLDTTCRNMMKQSRNHPSIIEYVGGNEMGWARSQNLSPLQVMQNVAAQESDRLFRASNPEPDNYHGPYWFDILQSKDSYSYNNGYFMSDTLKSRDGYAYYNGSDSDTMWYGEFGVNSPANLEVWQREIPLQSQWPLDNVYNDPILSYHNAVNAAGGDVWLFKPRIDAAFGAPGNLPELVKGGQYYGAEGLRYIYDALRRKGQRIGGMTSHDFSEPWPNAAGSYMVDYDGRPLMNYDFLKQALAPISLSLKIDSCLYTPATGINAELFLVSDAPQAATGLHAKWVARDREGTVFDHGESTASIAPLEVKSLGTITVHPPDQTIGGPVFVELRLEDSGGKLLVERVEIFGRADLPHPFAGLLNTTNTTSSANPVSRTALQVTAGAVRLEGDQEVLELQVTNTGKMTALFCEPHPLLVYRTDLFIDNNNCFIPPGEGRVITIRAASNPDCGLSLAQTGWRLSTWNADDVTVSASADVLLSVGRWDKMCREYAGYFDVNQVTNGVGTVCTGNRPDASQLPYRLSGSGTAQFQFNCSGVQTNHPARLRIHTADQANTAPTAVQIVINGRTMEQTLPQGLGIQNTDPAHRAFPATVEFELAGSDLRENTNTLTVSVPGNGWFSWDSLELLNKP